jgi:site-specific recombinase XerD
MTWTEAVNAYLRTHREATARRYRSVLEEFAAWYRQSYGEEPEPALLTDEEAREWRAYLTGVRKQSSSTVNVKLAALKGLARTCGVRLEVKGVRKVERPIETLSGRELGRLMRVVENHRWGPGWLRLRNAAMVALMARAGLRVGELVALDRKDVELNKRSGWVTIREGKGLKERHVPLSLQARKALAAYLKERPETDTPALFLSKGWQRLDERPVQRMIKSAAQRAGIEQDVTPHILRHSFATPLLAQGR